MKRISKLHYITNSKSENEILFEVQNVLDTGVDWIQLRIKENELDFLSIAIEVKKLCKNRAIFIINDNVEIAKKINADGVHLGANDMSIKEARGFLGNKIIGGTANTIVDCKNLELAKVDYIGLGPYRQTETKKELSPILGIEGYENFIPKNENYGWVTLSLNIPVLAIGGIVLNDLDDLMKRTSVHGIAVSGLINNSDEKAVLIKELKNKLG